jgi:hypothetical protein
VKESKGVKKRCPFTAEDCVLALTNALTECKAPEVLHGDCGGQFFTKKYQNYLKEHGIKQCI